MEGREYSKGGVLSSRGQRNKAGCRNSQKLGKSERAGSALELEGVCGYTCENLWPAASAEASLNVANGSVIMPTSSQRSRTVRQTAPPGHYVLLYDGACHLCRGQVDKLRGLARAGAIHATDFQEPGVLDQFPGLTHAACMERMHLVCPDGRVYGGFEAAVQAVATRPWWGWLAYAYYAPGLRQICDALYSCVAAHRYRLWGRAKRKCPGATCAAHRGLTPPARHGARR
jgi:predicted DCC family thiol-disulfide oxidoreductase YuxK